MLLRWIHLKNSTFLSLKIIFDTDWCQEWNIKHHFLKSVKIKILLSDANVPVRFRAQQRAKYSSLQLKANCIAAIRCLRHYIKLIWESPTTEDTNFHPYQRSFHSKLESNGLQCWPQPNVFRVYFSTLAIFKATSRLFNSQGCSDEEIELTFAKFTIRFVDFAVQFSFRCKFSF